VRDEANAEGNVGRDTRRPQRRLGGNRGATSRATGFTTATAASGARSWGIGHAGKRQIKTITVELPDGSLHKVYFDVTELWKKWKPPG